MAYVIFCIKIISEMVDTFQFSTSLSLSHFKLCQSTAVVSFVSMYHSVTVYYIQYKAVNSLQTVCCEGLYGTPSHCILPPTVIYIYYI